MKHKLGKPVTFRAWIETEERLECARKMGMNVPELINEILAKHLKDHMEGERDKLNGWLTEVLATPIP